MLGSNRRLGCRGDNLCPGSDVFSQHIPVLSQDSVVMLHQSFLHLPGIDASLEDALWTEGVTSWEDLEQHSRGNTYEIKAALDESRTKLDGRDAAYFADRMPAFETWRLYPEFVGETAFLDIETTGL